MGNRIEPLGVERRTSPENCKKSVTAIVGAKRGPDLKEIPLIDPYGFVHYVFIPT